MPETQWDHGVLRYRGTYPVSPLSVDEVCVCSLLDGADCVSLW